jgi:hypothetical protein
MPDDVQEAVVDGKPQKRVAILGPKRAAETYTAKRPGYINVGDLGVQATDEHMDAQFLAVMQAAKAGARALPPAISSDASGTRVIELGAGTYTFTELKALMGREGMTSKVNGIRFQGAGRGLTVVVFSPAETGALMFNDYWLNIAISGITFATLTAGSTFMQSYTTHSAQQYTFTDVGWSGPWKYVFDLQGNDNNSEFTFYSCSTSKLANDGTFLYIGGTNTSDQFLNYWFYGFKHWSTSASIIDASRGGHFHFFGADVSDWGSALTAPRKLFNLRGFVHSQGVTHMHVNSLRVEAKSPHCGLLYSEWPSGNVSIQTDWSSQMPFQTYGNMVDINVEQNNGAIYNIHDSHLAGTINVTYGVNAYTKRHAISVRNTHWAQKLTPSEVVTYTQPAANKIDPHVDFIGCRGDSSDPITTTASGATAWDATVGATSGDLVKPVTKRQLLVHGINGGLSTPSGRVRFNLPVGALITGFRAFAPAGTSTEADGGSFSLSTTEATPTVVASLTLSTARSAGYNLSTELAVPYLCSARQKATLDVLATDITQTNALNHSIVVEGYW